jgi:murein DD-endopeptidase MepM/ murein hydrolase activator NlpD
LYQREQQDFGSEGSGGAVALAPAAFGRAGLTIETVEKPEAAPRRRWGDIDLVVDLGARLGSPEWFRGLATLGGMLAALWHFAPGFGPLPGGSPAMLAPAQFDEMRAIAVAPAAYGADSGRRLAPTDRAEPLTATPERPRLDLVATIGLGDGLARVLEREGASAADAAEAASLVSGAVPLSDIAGGTRLAITLGRRPNREVARPLDGLSFRARFDLALSLERVNGRLVLNRQPIAVDDTPMRLTGDVGDSLYRSERSAGATPSVVADYIRAVAPHVDIGDISPFDRYDLVFEHKRAATGEVQTGRLLYAGIVHEGKQVRLLRWTLDGREQWFDAAGVGERREGFSMPVSGARMTSNFGMRFHPILGFSRMHQGVDLAAPYGTPIVAASDGVVRFAGWHGGHGNFVQIAHAGGMGTGYGHMSRYVVRPGQSVRQGQLIGYVGSTGLSTGPHCHFEVYRGGQPINPATARFAMTSQIAGEALQRFRATLARLTGLPIGGKAEVAATAKTPSRG